MKNKKSIEKLAEQIIDLEMNILNQDKDIQKGTYKIEKIMESLSPEELFYLIEIIEEKNNKN